MILLLLLTQLAGADCDRSKIQGSNKCQLCFVDSNSKTTFGNPWKTPNKLTEKQKLAAALNSVSCKNSGGYDKMGKLSLPSADADITDKQLYSVIMAIYKKLPDSHLNAYHTGNPRTDANLVCDRGAPGEPTERGLEVKGPYTKKANPIGYLSSILNTCMLKLGAEYAKKYCYPVSSTQLPANDEYSRLRSGVQGLMSKFGF